MKRFLRSVGSLAIGFSPVASWLAGIHGSSLLLVTSVILLAGGGLLCLERTERPC
jgi:hypothetical protein